MASALLRSHLPSRIVFRLPSGATNRMRRRPFGSFAMLAIVHSAFFVPGLFALAGRHVQPEQVGQRVEVGDRQPTLAGHEPAHGRLCDADLFAYAVAGQAAGIDRPAYLVAQLFVFLRHAENRKQYFG